MEDDWIFKQFWGAESSSECKMKEDARTQNDLLDLLAPGSVNQREDLGARKGSHNRREHFEHNQERNRKQTGMK